MKLQLPILPLLIQSVISTPITPETSSSQSSSLALSEIANIPSLNTSSTSNASLTDYRFNPYRFRVPTTDIVLHLGFGMKIQYHRIDLEELQSLLLLAKDRIRRGIDAHGLNTGYPTADNGRQYFRECGLGTLRLDVVDFVAGESHFSWGDLWNVVEGLRLYMLVGRMNLEAYFTFWEEPKTEWWYQYRRLGQGEIVRERPDIENE